MNKKTKAIVSDIISDILTAPIKAAAKCVDYADKVKNIETKTGTVGTDISAAVAKAKEAGADAKDKVVKKAKELAETEQGQKIIGTAKDVYAKAGETAKDVYAKAGETAGKVGEKVGEYKEKVSDYIDSLKNKVDEEEIKEDLDKVFDEICDE